MTQVFDASAVLAAIFEEPGADRVEALWAEGDNLLCAVNYAGVVAKLAEHGMGNAEIPHRPAREAPAWKRRRGASCRVREILSSSA